MNWPQGTCYMSEYSDSNLLSSSTFLTLYPYGSKDDVTFRDRHITVSLADTNCHLLKYAIKVPSMSVSICMAQPVLATNLPRDLVRAAVEWSEAHLTCTGVASNTPCPLLAPPQTFGDYLATIGDDAAWAF